MRGELCDINGRCLIVRCILPHLLDARVPTHLGYVHGREEDYIMQLEQDWRLLEQMRMSLRYAPASVVALGRLVAELEPLSQQLAAPDREWQRRFLVHWGTLEEVFAVALDRNLETLDVQGAAIVDSALAELRVLADEALACLPPRSLS